MGVLFLHLFKKFHLAGHRALIRFPEDGTQSAGSQSHARVGAPALLYTHCRQFPGVGFCLWLEPPAKVVLQFHAILVS